MEDFGDILFYVIAAIIAIAGAIANKRKKTAQKSVPQSGMPEQKEEITFPDVEEDIRFPGNEVRETTTQYKMIDQDILQKAESGSEDISSQSFGEQPLRMDAEYEGEYAEPLAQEFASEGVSAIDISITQSELGTRDELSVGEENSWARNLIEDFELPKAIVYSEFLRRKDFV